jgi:hypothetical protein
VFFGITVLATLYFGWHYVVDDIAGMGIGWASVTIAARATGHRRARKRPVDVVPEPGIAAQPDVEPAQPALVAEPNLGDPRPDFKPAQTDLAPEPSTGRSRRPVKEPATEPLEHPA